MWGLQSIEQTLFCRILDGEYMQTDVVAGVRVKLAATIPCVIGM
jgi:hypothetical protein